MKPGFEKVSVIGLGYVGLPTAAVFASRGVQVLGIDTNRDTVELIKQGHVHIVEPDLDIMVKGAVAAGKLTAADRPQPADAFIIAVPTPFTDGHKPDLSHLKSAAENLAPVLKKGDLVVIESTCPVGTTEAFCGWLADLRPQLTFPHQDGEEADVQVAHSPERVLPGRVLIELVNNDRVVGGVSRRCAERTVELYKLAVNGECLVTDARTAELVKLAENAYRDVNIAFANELAEVGERLGIDVWEAVELANRHPRVNILRPGPGVGGHCIAVDPWFIVDSAPADTDLIQAARKVNDSRPQRIAERVLEAANRIDNACIACLGLSYKADIDDLRQSPAVGMVEILAKEATGRVLIAEPHLETLPEGLAGSSRLELTELDDALERAEIVVLLVDHKPFRMIDRQRLAGKTVFDTRGVWR